MSSKVGPFFNEDKLFSKTSIQGTSVPSVMVTDTKMKEKDIKSGSVAASLEESVAYIEVSRIKFLNYYNTSRKWNNLARQLR